MSIGKSNPIFLSPCERGKMTSVEETRTVAPVENDTIQDLLAQILVLKKENKALKAETYKWHQKCIQLRIHLREFNKKAKWRSECRKEWAEEQARATVHKGSQKHCLQEGRA